MRRSRPSFPFVFHRSWLYKLVACHRLSCKRICHFQNVTCFADSGGFVLQTRAKWFSLPQDLHIFFFAGHESLWGYGPPQFLHLHCLFESYCDCVTPDELMALFPFGMSGGSFLVKLYCVIQGLYQLSWGQIGWGLLAELCAEGNLTYSSRCLCLDLQNRRSSLGLDVCGNSRGFLRPLARPIANCTLRTLRWLAERSERLFSRRPFVIFVFTDVLKRVEDLFNLWTALV